MKNVGKIEKMIDAEAKKRTNAVIKEAEPRIEAEVRKAMKDEVRKRLAALRASVEQTERAQLVRELLNGEPLKTPIKATIRVDNAELTPAVTQKLLGTTLDPITAARGIIRTKRGWKCAFCETKFDTQRAASIHARGCDQRAAVLSGKVPPPSAKTTKRQKPVVKTREKVKTRTCIKPGCRKKSKGPRHHHLCDTHLNVPKRQWKSWQKKDREARAEA